LLSRDFLRCRTGAPDASLGISRRPISVIVLVHFRDFTLQRSYQSSRAIGHNLSGKPSLVLNSTDSRILQRLDEIGWSGDAKKSIGHFGDVIRLDVLSLPSIDECQVFLGDPK
jgi:hypothetical protein